MSPKMVLAPLAGLALMAVAGAPPAGSRAGGPSPGAGAAGGLAWPLAGWALTQPYGCTAFDLEPAAPWCPGGHFHSGVDLAAPAGTPVHAAAAGTARVTESPAGYGLAVLLDHGGGVLTLYGHLEWTGLRGGETVAAGDEVGRVGSSGLSTGPHLHFEVRRDGRPVDPAPWLPAPSPMP